MSDRSPGLPTTRPAVATRKARRTGAAKKVTRYTLDLEPEQHRYLRMFAVQHDLSASLVMRALLYLLEAGNELPAGHTLSDLVLDEIFAVDETPEGEPVVDDEDEEASAEADPNGAPTEIDDDEDVLVGVATPVA